MPHLALMYVVRSGFALTLGAVPIVTGGIATGKGINPNSLPERQYIFSHEVQPFQAVDGRSCNVHGRCPRLLFVQPYGLFIPIGATCLTPIGH